ncbi:MarR family winged helix-turn-helix transcriptional regulator [Streptomyces sp. NPDC005494]|uniref:MarR family winged helix-turn-helix transcriptional regulator n=1 Tax=Streptomyces sp. NPDC005494 TaxID=3364715 RepID=UPI0036979B97
MTDAARNMPQLLGEAKRWFDDALLAGMRAAGEQPVTAAQAAVFASLDPEGTSISELARRMGVTRQTTHQAVHSLIGMGMLDQTADPDSARSRIVRFTPDGARAHERAQIMLAEIEAILAERIGDQAGRLRDILTRPWGEPPRLTPGS